MFRYSPDPLPSYSLGCDGCHARQTGLHLGSYKRAIRYSQRMGIQSLDSPDGSDYLVQGEVAYGVVMGRGEEDTRSNGEGVGILWRESPQ